MQQRNDQRQQITRHLLIALCGGMDAVGLHTSCGAVNIFEQKREQRHVILLRQQCVGLVELADVIRAIVRRERDAAEHDLSPRALQRGDDLIEIPSRTVDGKPAETIVAAEGYYDNRRLEGEHILQALNAVFGCIAANAGIHHVVMKAPVIEIAFEKIRIAVAGVGAVACGQTIAEGHDHRAVVTRRGNWLRSRSRSGCLSRRFRRRVLTVTSTGGERKCSNE